MNAFDFTVAQLIATAADRADGVFNLEQDMLPLVSEIRTYSKGTLVSTLTPTK